MKEALDLLLRLWPLIAAGITGFGLIAAMLWRVATLVKDVISRLDNHTTKQAEIVERIDKLEDATHAIDTRVAVVEAYPRMANGRH